MSREQSVLGDHTHTSDRKSRKGRKSKCYDKFRCPSCKAELGRKSSLIRHLKTHSQNKPHLCEKCGKSFQEKGQLKRHDQVHTGIKPFKCNDCGKLYSDNVNLKKHKVRCAIDDKPKIEYKEREEDKDENHVITDSFNAVAAAYNEWLITQNFFFLYERELLFQLHLKQAELWSSYVTPSFNSLSTQATVDQNVRTDLQFVNSFFNEKYE